ncbi:MAG: hypothetical protein K0U54_12615 [Bacteroidetes bacterium]|nr:hypothetical protein [Bacteroidota bacterium]
MKWTNNNNACVAVWGALLVLAQNTKPFFDSDGVTIGSFPYWSDLESKSSRKLRAKMFATSLDNIFRNFNGAEYEDRISRSKAINKMTTILIQDSDTLADLADMVDEQYFFVGEVKNVS